MRVMWIEISLVKAPTEHITYTNVSHITYTAKYLKVHFKDGSRIKMLESTLEDVSWGARRRGSSND